jgi:hypothetical protein
LVALNRHPVIASTATTISFAAIRVKNVRTVPRFAGRIRPVLTSPVSVSSAS